jgi:hypothetical protein
VGVVRGNGSNDGRSQVVPDPDGGAGAEMILQLKHVFDDLT